MWVCAILAWILGQTVRIPVGGIPVTPLDGVMVVAWIVWKPWRFFHLIYRQVTWGRGLIFILLTMLLSQGAAVTLFELPSVLWGALYTARFIFYCAPLIVPCSKQQAKKVRTYLQYALGVTAGVGLAQFVLFPNLASLAQYGWDPHWYRLVGTWLDPNFIGLACAAGILMLLEPVFVKGSWVDQERDGVMRYARVWLSALLFVALILTFSRSAYTALAVMGIFLLIRFRSAQTIALVCISILIMIASFIPRLLIDESKDIDRNESAQARILSWRRALKVAARHPFGVGYNTFKEAQLTYHLILPTDKHGYTGSDSSLLFIAATTGFLGLGVWIYFLAKLVGWAVHNGDAGFVLGAGLAGWIVHAQFVNSLLFPPLLFFFWSWVSVVRAQKHSH